MKSSENLIDQFAALIDNGQENKKTMENKQLKSFKDPDCSLSRLCRHLTLNFIRCVWERVGGPKATEQL